MMTLPLWRAAWAAIVGAMFCYPLALTMVAGIESAGRPDHRAAPESPWWFFRQRSMAEMDEAVSVWIVLAVFCIIAAKYQAQHSVVYNYYAYPVEHSAAMSAAWVAWTLAPLAMGFWQAAICLALAPRFRKPGVLAIASVLVAGVAWVALARLASHGLDNIDQFWPDAWETQLSIRGWPEFFADFTFLAPEDRHSTNCWAPASGYTVRGDALAPLQLLAGIGAFCFARLSCFQKGDAWFRFES